MCWSIEVSLIAALYGYTASIVLYRRGVSSALLLLSCPACVHEGVRVGAAQTMGSGGYHTLTHSAFTKPSTTRDHRGCEHRARARACKQEVAHDGLEIHVIGIPELPDPYSPLPPFPLPLSSSPPPSPTSTRSAIRGMLYSVRPPPTKHNAPCPGFPTHRVTLCLYIQSAMSNPRLSSSCPYSLSPSPLRRIAIHSATSICHV